MHSTGLRKLAASDTATQKEADHYLEKFQKTALTILESYQPEENCGVALSYPVTKPSTYAMSLILINIKYNKK